jgi:CHAT domain-containing protein
MAVFDKHRVSAPPASEVLDVRPSPEFMKAQMPRFDHVFYVGHGVRQLDGRTGLILIDEAGKPQLFSGEDILTLGELRQAPVIYLSACEGAAQEAIGGSEVFSFASCLLRAGAAFVIANLWAVSDRVARVFAREWYACLADTPDPARAYCVALSRTRKALPSVAAAGLEPPIDHPVWWSCFAPWLGG